MKTQEELTAIVRDYFSEWVRLGLFMSKVYESSLDVLLVVSFLKMVVTIPFVYEDEDLIYEEEVL